MNILLAVDHSPQSQNAVNLLQRIQFPARSTLYLLSVLETPTWVEGLEGLYGFHKRTKRSFAQSKESVEAWASLSKLEKTCVKPRLKVTPLVTNGIPGGKILSAIDKYKIDLVVVGTRGRTGLKRFLLGSVSEWVLTEAPCSVLVVREKSGVRTKKAKSVNLLIANDGSSDSKLAIEFARQMEFPPTSHITVCHVLEESSAVETELAAQLGVTGRTEIGKLAEEVRKVREREGKEVLKSSASMLGRRARPIKKLLTYGHPADQLLTLAKRQKTDLVIMGSRGITGLRRFVLGSVSNKVVSHAPCSVLVVRKSKARHHTKSAK